ncbi:hypothetical protein BX600DRAFT_553868 [Xylariales sp. PMI_506]|nr:hypothetical protein BX600DRAFT_553868 [Xylariales sp. PMI_506]
MTLRGMPNTKDDGIFSVPLVGSLLPQWNEPESTRVSVDGMDFAPQPLAQRDDCSSPSSKESTHSKWSQPSVSHSSTLTGSSPRNSATEKSEHLIQTLGPSSFVIKTTKVVVSPRDLELGANYLKPEISITSEEKKAPTPPIPDLAPEEIPTSHADSTSTESIVSYMPEELRTTESDTTATNDPEGNALVDLPRVEDEIPLKDHCSHVRGLFLVESSDEGPHSLQDDSDCNHSTMSNLFILQREVRMMSVSCPELVLANIKSGIVGGSDATMYKELEMVKKRWMFSVLFQQKDDASMNITSYHSRASHSSSTLRLLAIYEGQASASFIAARHPNVTISHLSVQPISPTHFPNVRPLLVPAVSAAAASRALSQHLFSSAICLSLPALFPSAEILPFLRHVNRCLAPGAALRLILIDPQPVAASMGPLLRQWLIEKLLINLEQSFRTTLPSRSLPAWLAVSHLRGSGSTITTVSVPAVPAGLGRIRGVREKSAVLMELQCLVMRMLWQEVWSSFVYADRWWWEDEDIVSECAELGTYWRYSHIVAVKES